MAKHGFVYLWRDKKHKRYYVGCHWGKEDDGYVCSSNWMRSAYKHRPQDFKRKILTTGLDRKAMYAEEARWLAMIQPNEIKVRYYNLHNSCQNLWHSDPNYGKTVGQKISASKKGKPIIFKDPTERARRISEGKKRAFDLKRQTDGHSFDPSHCEKIRLSKVGTTHTPESKAKIGAATKLRYAI